MRRPSLLLLSLAACAGGGDSLSLSTPEKVSAATSVGAAPMLALAPDGSRTIAWVSAPGGGTDGRLFVVTRAAGASDAPAAPSELRDPLGPIEPHGEAPPKVAYGPDGTLYALYAVGKVVPGRRFPASALRLARSTDGGRSWSAPATVAMDAAARDDFAASRNFHALHAAADGSLYVAWLEGSHHGSAAYITRSTDGGATWIPAVRIATSEACPCCRTSIATAADGTVYVAWRAVLPGNVRDVVVARSSDHGATWSAPVRVHADGWVIEACPHAGPSLQVDGRGRLHVAWWTGKEGSAGVFYARSDDGARTFGTPVVMRAAESSSPSHVQLALAGESTVVVAWDDGTVQTPRVLVRVSRDGGDSFGDATPASEDGRAASFPVLAAGRSALTLGWSEQASAEHRHAESSRPDMKDPKAVMGLPAVGATQVIVRTARLE